MNDLINRQKAIDLEYIVKDINGVDYVMLSEVQMKLRKMPSAQPERERIKWIPHKSVFGGLDERVYTCDKCGYNIGFHVENFCPNCGGKYER